MHANLLLEPYLWDHVATRQQELLDVARASCLRGTRVPWRRCGDSPCAGADTGAGGSSGLAVEPEPAHTPEKLRAS